MTRQTMRQREALAGYEARRKRREADRERALGGETLAAFHARENAPPPTLAEIFAKNQVNRERCPWTPDMLQPRRRKGRAGH